MLADHIEYIGVLKDKVANESGKILNLMISGSHAFGFESPDSDTDYRGCYQVVTNKLLTTKKPKDFLEYKVFKEGMTLADTDMHDVYDKETVLDELSKEIGLLLAGNCNHYEHLFGKQIMSSPEHKYLKKFFTENMNLQGIMMSYQGMATQNYKKFILGGKHTVKKYLYVLRGLMAGTYALEEKSIEPNIYSLSKHFGGREIVEELIELKKRGNEKGHVNKRLGVYNKEVDYWFERIEETADHRLPDDWGMGQHERSIKAREQIDKWLMKTRLGYIDGY